MESDFRRINKLIRKYFFLHFEWIVLMTGLLLMIFLDPFSQAESICPAKRLNLQFCPGCGLGRSISQLFRGEFVTSIQTHPAGILATMIIPARIGKIFYRNHKLKITDKYEKDI